ncbi:DUF2306 domain-containing protein [Rhodobacteraceae bacterium CCMM004]|nr:DUF2306 domain-containing protein [Rhodobacteraceae bacterium CCMM004]
MPELLHSAPLAVQAHLAAAVLALLIGPFALFRRRRDAVHRTLGYLWVIAMVATAVSSFFVRSVFGIWGAGPIHLLSVWVLYTLWVGVQAARSRDLARHRSEMRGLYLYGLCVAGMLTLLPGRRLNVLVFGEAEMAGVGVIAMGIALLLLVAMRDRRKTAAARFSP